MVTDTGECHGSEHQCTSTEHSRHQLCWSKTSKLKLLQIIIYFCHEDIITWNIQRKAMLKTDCYEKKNQMQMKEILHAYCCNYKMSIFFCYTEECISHLTCCTMAHGVIITGLSPARPRFNPQACPHGIYSGQSGIGWKRFSPLLPQISLLSPTFHQLLINPWSYIILATDRIIT
jgi:hypothetical protein